MATKKKDIALPISQGIICATSFEQQGENLVQVLEIKRPAKVPKTAPKCSLPLGKALRGSVIFVKRGDKYVTQNVRLYRKGTAKKTQTIYESRYAKVYVSKTRATISMSFPLCDDPERLKARMQNFANIVYEETDDIIEMLSLEGDMKVREAWAAIDESVDKETLNIA